MIEIKTVRDKYASMPDSELVSFAREEGYKLTEEGFDLLKTELISRKLDITIIEETAKMLAHEGDIKRTTVYNRFTEQSWSYAFDEKEYGKSDSAIIAGLIETGIEEPDALLLIANMELMAKQRLKKAELEKLTGGLAVISGIAITFLPLSIASNRLAYIIAWCMILYGLLRAVKGIFNKSRFKKIILNIQHGNNC